jgi:hypothetical protein
VFGERYQPWPQSPVQTMLRVPRSHLPPTVAGVEIPFECSAEELRPPRGFTMQVDHRASRSEA